MDNITELRKSLCENYEKIKSGEMDLKMGKELTNAAGKIIASVKVELEYSQYTGAKNKISFLESKESGED